MAKRVLWLANLASTILPCIARYRSVPAVGLQFGLQNEPPAQVDFRGKADQFPRAASLTERIFLTTHHACTLASSVIAAWAGLGRELINTLVHGLPESALEP